MPTFYLQIPTKIVWSRWDSNQRPPPCKGGSLCPIPFYRVGKYGVNKQETHDHIKSVSCYVLSHPDPVAVRLQYSLFGHKEIALR
jgi:hypothetical protein